MVIINIFIESHMINYIFCLYRASGGNVHEGVGKNSIDDKGEENVHKIGKTSTYQ